ncbi:S8 family serine peptidase [Nonomuraea sp. SYSU D8015]|uniref:S8 family serine peptidase n=1 Tax=Nonomuraea sp. SYSU D8015 TaxID=2593644 RepID=UPI0016613E15|nr:S8 family serine peptidase [Nonomuraea sp. SYSU D8015]
MAGTALVLAAGTAPSAAAPHHQAAPAATAPAETRPTGAVTLALITGDVVDYRPGQGGAPSVAIRPAPRPDGVPITFATLPSRDGGHLVLPSDAASMVAAGTLDEELFDVETLARDQRSAAIPLIITYTGEQPLARAAAALPAAENVRVLDSVNGAAVTVPADGTDEFWAGLRTARTASGIAEIWLDRRTEASLDRSVPLIGAPTAWERGYDGKGVKVAVLDTGIDVGHADFAGRILATENFSDAPGIADRQGHGTHVASTIAGAGEKYRGVAPAASLLVGKVLGDGGRGDWSWAIAGMEWAAEQGADVVNMSLGTCCGDGTDPMSRALDELTKKHGTLFVTAAGNASHPLTVSVPAAADEALAVGAVDKTAGTTLAGFSSKGPRLGDAAVKPNLVAPGVDIVAARSAASGAPPAPGDDRYTSNSGTSMAAPHVAGAAAILAQRHPDWRAGELRDALTSTAVRNDAYNWFEQGSGRVDVARAIGQSVFATSVVDFRLLGASRATRQITYRNTGAAPVTLSLSLLTRGWSGKPGPARAVALGADSVTVPANGTATVDLKVDPAAGPIGACGGWVTAAGGDDVRLVTPFSYYTGPATHRLGVSLVNSYGTKEFFPGYQAEPIVYAIPLKRPNSPEDPFNPYGYYYLRTDFSGHGEFMLPAGDHELIGVAVENRISNRNSWVIETVTLDGDETVTLDARKTVPIRPDTPKAADGGGQAYYVRTFTDRNSPVSLYGGSVGGGHDLYVTPVRAPKAGKLRLSHQWNLEPPVLASATAGPVGLRPAYDMDALRSLASVTTYPVIYVGRGRPEDFAGVDVTGKVVLAGIPVEGGERPYVTASAAMDDAAQNAARRGAAGILGFLDADGARARVPAGGPAFLRLGLSAAEGRAVRSALAGGPVSLRLEPYAGPKVTYHLRFDERGRVPAKPVKVGMGELVRIDAAYHADQPDTSGWEYGESSTGEEPGRMTYGGSLRMPVARTEYFGPVSDEVTWSRTITNHGLDLRSDDRFTGHDRRLTEQWFKAPLTPGAADLPGRYPVEVPCALCRDGDRFVPAEQWRDSDPRHYSGLGPVTSAPRLLVGDQEVPVQGRRPRSFVVPRAAGPYRLEAVDTTDRALSRKVTTTSRFASTPPPVLDSPRGYACSFGTGCAFQPAVQLTYDLPLDLLNRAAAGTRFAFDLRAAPHSAVRRAPAVNRVRVEYSVDDGATWRDASRVRPRGGGRFQVELTHPARAETSGYVSLRITASDTGGGSVTQTIDRAYALR